MGPSKRRKLEKVYALIERDLEVIGSTAVQDNLQDKLAGQHNLGLTIQRIPVLSHILPFNSLLQALFR